MMLALRVLILLFSCHIWLIYDVVLILEYVFINFSISIILLVLMSKVLIIGVPVDIETKEKDSQKNFLEWFVE